MEYKRIKYGERVPDYYEANGWDGAKDSAAANDWANTHPCGCGVHKGELHVPGCDDEQCPKCHGQMISCGCDRLQQIQATLEFIQTHEPFECEGWAENSYEEDVSYLLSEIARLSNLTQILRSDN